MVLHVHVLESCTFIIPVYLYLYEIFKLVATSRSLLTDSTLLTFAYAAVTGRLSRVTDNRMSVLGITDMEVTLDGRLVAR